MDAVIVAALRSPMGKSNKGLLANIRIDDLGGHVVKELLKRVPKLDPKERIKDFTAEVELGFDEETARKECGRCLRCDVSWMAARDKSMAVAGGTVPTPTRGEERDSPRA